MRLFSTEAVSKYHPDKYADQISDAILTECLKQDRQGHCGIETMVKGNTVVLGGEITSKADINYDQIVRRVAKKLGYRADTAPSPPSIMAITFQSLTCAIPCAHTETTFCTLSTSTWICMQK